MTRRDPLPVRPLLAAFALGCAAGAAGMHAGRPAHDDVRGRASRCCDGSGPVAFDWSRLPCPVPGHRK